MGQFRLTAVPKKVQSIVVCPCIRKNEVSDLAHITEPAVKQYSSKARQ